jgi:hypothetical protein
MTERASFYRKIAYGIAIAIIAVGMMRLSAPATASKQGGKLAELRKQYRLAQVNIGEIDPASETIKLVTLGLRGVAVNWLWNKADNYKKKEDWTNLTATLEQLAKLQPNFIIFWKFQAWNLTYNVSVEFDDYKDRYFYVRRGIEFLHDGLRYNVDNPQLLWDLGWFIGQKIGRADEYVQYRRLFRADENFLSDLGYADRPLDDRDNWLVGKEAYRDAIDAVDKKGHSIGRKSPRGFYSSPAMSQMNYSEAIEEEGYFEKARRGWEKAAREWREFGELFIEHSTGVKLQLGAQPRLEKEVAELRAKLDAMLPGTRDKLAEEKRNALTTQEREILDTTADKLTPQEAEQLYQINEKIQVTDRDVAERIAAVEPAKARQALSLASELERQATLLRYTVNYKRDANYDYWQTRADFEQTPDALEAREKMFQAKQARQEADVIQAKKLYEEGFAKWRAVIDEFPAILDEEWNIGEDILEFIRGYREILDQLEETIGEDFPLWEVIEKFDREQIFTEELNAHKARQAQDTGATPPSNAQGETPESNGASP